MVRRRFLLLLVAALLATYVNEPRQLDGYRPAVVSGDSTRVAARAATVGASAATTALVSLAGLPPVAGTLAQSGGSIVFRPAADGSMTVLPLFRSAGTDGTARTPAVTLLEVTSGDDSPVFLFHLGAAVVETSTPGILGELVAEPARIAELGTPWTTGALTLVPRGDVAGAMALIRSLVASAYADSVYAVFGPPSRPIGIVGPRGERAGRLGEYLSRRDSIALSPAFMTSQAQLRHSLAHELAHRWLREHPQSAEALSAVMSPIRDSLRYGFRNQDEQLAESLAFAVHFLDASGRGGGRASPALLESYERLIPGTRNAAALLLALPAYERHPLVRTAWALKGPEYAANH
jgi:hypothetical protein